jgi:hypothetical protein
MQSKGQESRRHTLLAIQGNHETINKWPITVDNVNLLHRTAAPPSHMFINLCLGGLTKTEVVDPTTTSRLGAGTLSVAMQGPELVLQPISLGVVNCQEEGITSRSLSAQGRVEIRDQE